MHAATGFFASQCFATEVTHSRICFSAVSRGIKPDFPTAVFLRVAEATARARSLLQMLVDAAHSVLKIFMLSSRLCFNVGIPAF